MLNYTNNNTRTIASTLDRSVRSVRSRWLVGVARGFKLCGAQVQLTISNCESLSFQSSHTERSLSLPPMTATPVHIVLNRRRIKTTTARIYTVTLTTSATETPNSWCFFLILLSISGQKMGTLSIESQGTNEMFFF